MTVWSGQGSGEVSAQAEHIPTHRLVSLKLRRAGCLSSAEDYGDGLRQNLSPLVLS